MFYRDSVWKILKDYRDSVWKVLKDYRVEFGRGRMCIFL
jgi:hypothetical protein